MNYYAHLNNAENDIQYQTLKDHLLNVAKYSSEVLSSCNLGTTGYLAGLLHDMGKYKKEFQDYLINGGTRGSVIHTFQGYKYCLENIDFDNLNSQLSKEIIGFAIGAHHGLFDCVDSDHVSGIEYRYEKQNIGYLECKENFLNDVSNEINLKNLFLKSENEISIILKTFTELINENHQREELCFYISLLCRQVLSAVIYSDHRDTSEFNNKKIRTSNLGSSKIWDDIINAVEKKVNSFDESSEINKARKWISEKCKENSKLPNGIYKLNVPTGGGKTLSVLRYAVNHAKKYNSTRIILVSPLLSILDQNADVVRSAVGNDSVILEHHSNIVRDADDYEEDIKLDTLKENWDAPIIITTLVQLLNTMFAGGSSNIKRFNSLSNSIIVIDEIQTLPTKVTSMFNLMCNYLSNVCNTTIVLCSATQPSLESVKHKIVDEISDLVPYDYDIWKSFERTVLIDAGQKTESELTDFILEKSVSTQSLLLVCNTKKEAEYFYKRIKDNIDDRTFVYHLSASLCQQHRKDVIMDLRKKLNENKKVVMISTQVIEAGIDVSFSTVVRITAGMDSVIQASGRCNRNHEMDLSEVYIVTLNGEKLGQLKDIESAKTATLALLTDFKDNTDKYDRKLDSQKSIKKYYSNFFEDKDRKSELDYPRDITKHGTLLDLLSNNSEYNDERVKVSHNWILRQSFKMATNEFTVFNQNTIDVLVPYKDGKNIINELYKKSDDLDVLKSIIKKAKLFGVSLYEYQFELLNKQNAISSINDYLYILDDDRFYDENLGIVVQSDKKLDLLEV